MAFNVTAALIGIYCGQTIWEFYRYYYNGTPSESVSNLALSEYGDLRWWRVPCVLFLELLRHDLSEEVLFTHAECIKCTVVCR